jgi:hypothetical protein
MEYRRMLEADRPKFMDLLTKHEQMHESRIKREAGASVEAASGVGVEERDEGTEKALRILDEWLDDPRNWEDPQITALKEENERLRRQAEVERIACSRQCE